METELRLAETARQRGNEGRARVCARRAAGIAARHFLQAHRIPVNDSSAYAVLRTLHDLPDTPADVRQAVSHLLLHVSEDFTLPAEIDLIADARWLIAALASTHPGPASDELQ